MKEATIKVRAARADTPVPMPRKARNIDKKTGRDLTLIYADAPVEVPNDAYYRRRIRKGDLVIVAEEKAARPAPARKGDQ